jgi:Mitochondrial branched-chain alpha-ketoacid dehydrogenase kinase
LLLLLLLQQYVAKSPTKYSLHELMRTGRPEEEPDQATTTTTNNKNNAFAPSSSSSSASALLLQQYRGRLGQRLESERILMQYASMLQKELPIRLAHRIDDLDNIPGLRDMPSIQAVKQLYLESLEAIVNAPRPGTDRRAEQQFAKLLDSLYRKHSSVLLQMAKGAQEFRSALKQGLIDWKKTIATTNNNSSSSNNNNNDDDDASTHHPWQFSQHDQCQIFLDRFNVKSFWIDSILREWVSVSWRDSTWPCGSSCYRIWGHQDHPLHRLPQQSSP